MEESFITTHHAALSRKISIFSWASRIEKQNLAAAKSMEISMKSLAGPEE